MAAVHTEILMAMGGYGPNPPTLCSITHLPSDPSCSADILFSSAPRAEFQLTHPIAVIHQVSISTGRKLQLTLQTELHHNHQCGTFVSFH